MAQKKTQRYCAGGKEAPNKQTKKPHSSQLVYNFWHSIYTNMYTCLEKLMRVFTNLSIKNRCAIKGNVSEYLLSSQHPRQRFFLEFPEYPPWKSLPMTATCTKLRRQKKKRGHYSLEAVLYRCVGRCDSQGLLGKLLTTTLLLPQT